MKGSSGYHSKPHRTLTMVNQGAVSIFWFCGPDNFSLSYILANWVRSRTCFICNSTSYLLLFLQMRDMCFKSFYVFYFFQQTTPWLTCRKNIMWVMKWNETKLENCYSCRKIEKNNICKVHSLDLISSAFISCLTHPKTVFCFFTVSIRKSHIRHIKLCP